MEGREGGMTHRIGALSVRFELGTPAMRTIASPHGAGVLPTELKATPPCYISVGDSFDVVSLI